MKTPLLFTLLTTASLLGGEHVVKAGKFETALKFDATFLPIETKLIEIKPEEWKDYRILELVEHGSEVKEGNPLVACDYDSYLRTLAARKEALKLQQISLEKSKRELAELEVQIPRENAKAKRLFQWESDSLAQYQKIDRALEIKQAEERQKRAERTLEYTEEELKQLLKMYEEDGLTEETEEIILKRQRSSVKTAELALERARAATKWALEKVTPKKDIDKKEAHENAKLQLDSTLAKNALRLKEKQIQLSKAEREYSEAQRKLENLKKDKSFFQLLAPTEGIIVHGSLEKNTWPPSATDKFLFPNGKLPSHKPFMTLIPKNHGLQLHAKLSQEDHLKLHPTFTGTAEIKGLPDLKISVKVNSQSSLPDSSGKYDLSLNAELPNEHPLVMGMKAKVSLVTYQNEKALTVPKKALKNATVQVKLTEGNSETRTVKIGREQDGFVEILSGLEEGLVVIFDDTRK